MKLVLRFLKPHWKMCVVTVFLLLIDVIGALIIPTFAAELMNEAKRAVPFETLAMTAVAMGVAAVISAAAAVGSVFACADLTARVGADMRDALYQKSLDLAVSDFRTFGTASITTRTVSDITTIQTALINTISIVLPVPLVFVVSIDHHGFYSRLDDGPDIARYFTRHYRDGGIYYEEFVAVVPKAAETARQDERRSA